MPGLNIFRSFDASTGETISSEVSPELLQAIGGVVVDWVHAEWVVHAGAAAFIGMNFDHGRILLPRISMRELVSAILIVADERDPTGKVAAELKPLATKLLREEQKRNETVHDRWWLELTKREGRAERTKKKTKMRPFTPAEVNQRAERITRAANEFAIALFKNAGVLPSKSP